MHKCKLLLEFVRVPRKKGPTGCPKQTLYSKNSTVRTWMAASRARRQRASWGAVTADSARATHSSAGVRTKSFAAYLTPGMRCLPPLQHEQQVSSELSRDGMKFTASLTPSMRYLCKR